MRFFCFRARVHCALDRRRCESRRSHCSCLWPSASISSLSVTNAFKRLCPEELSDAWPPDS